MAAQREEQHQQHQQRQSAPIHLPPKSSQDAATTTPLRLDSLQQSPGIQAARSELLQSCTNLPTMRGQIVKAWNHFTRAFLMLVKGVGCQTRLVPWCLQSQFLARGILEIAIKAQFDGHYQALKADKCDEVRKICNHFAVNVWDIYLEAGVELVDSLRAMKDFLAMSKSSDITQLSEALVRVDKHRILRGTTQSRHMRNDISVFAPIDFKNAKLQYQRDHQQPGAASDIVQAQHHSLVAPPPSSLSLEAKAIKNSAPDQQKKHSFTPSASSNHPSTPRSIISASDSLPPTPEFGRKSKQRDAFDRSSLGGYDDESDWNSIAADAETANGDDDDHEDNAFHFQYDMDDSSLIQQHDDTKLASETLYQPEHKGWTIVHPNWEQEYWGTEERLVYDKVEISRKEIKLLDEGEWLNDELINLGLALVKQSAHSSLRIYVASTFFLSRLIKSNSYPKDCWENIDWMLIPVHENYHWYLLILGNLGCPRDSKDLSDDDLPFGVVMDSLPRPRSSYIEVWSTIQTCLSQVFACETAALRLETPTPSIHQENNADCGIYLLEFARRVFKDVGDYIATFRSMKAQPPFHASEMRGKYRENIFDLKKAQDSTLQKQKRVCSSPADATSQPSLGNEENSNIYNSETAPKDPSIQQILASHSISESGIHAKNSLPAEKLDHELDEIHLSVADCLQHFYPGCATASAELPSDSDQRTISKRYWNMIKDGKPANLESLGAFDEEQLLKIVGHESRDVGIVGRLKRRLAETEVDKLMYAEISRYCEGRKKDLEAVSTLHDLLRVSFKASHDFQDLITTQRGESIALLQALLVQRIQTAKMVPKRLEWVAQIDEDIEMAKKHSESHPTSLDQCFMDLAIAFRNIQVMLSFIKDDHQKAVEALQEAERVFREIKRIQLGGESS